MLCALQEDGLEKFAKYWAAEREAQSALWRKCKPKASRDGTFFVVKSFRTSLDDGSAVDAASLPYELVEASPAIDIW